jgi:hypothetical protein
VLDGSSTLSAPGGFAKLGSTSRSRLDRVLDG